MAQLKDRRFSQTFVNLGKMGTANQLYIPWMQATYIMVANRQALQYLPAGANVNTLTYTQLKGGRPTSSGPPGGACWASQQAPVG